MHALFVVLLLMLSAPLAAQTPGLQPASTHADYWVGPAVTGSWFDPARSGEGLVLELLDDGSAALFWFTYPPAGEPGEQAWMFAISAAVDGDRIRFDAMLRPLRHARCRTARPRLHRRPVRRAAGIRSAQRAGAPDCRAGAAARTRPFADRRLHGRDMGARRAFPGNLGGRDLRSGQRALARWPVHAQGAWRICRKSA